MSVAFCDMKCKQKSRYIPSRSSANLPYQLLERSLTVDHDKIREYTYEQSKNIFFAQLCPDIINSAVFIISLPKPSYFLC